MKFVVMLLLVSFVLEMIGQAICFRPPGDTGNVRLLVLLVLLVLLALVVVALLLMMLVLCWWCWSCIQ